MNKQEPKPIKREYKVEGRNGYYAIDEYLGNRCIRTVLAGLTKKLANTIASELENAVYTYEKDNCIVE